MEKHSLSWRNWFKMYLYNEKCIV